MAEDYDLTWEKHNEASFRAFVDLRSRQSLVDVSLFCEGEIVRAHKLVLAACSLYFDRLFNSLRGDERNRATIIALPKMDVSLLKLSLDFMYSGKVTVPSEKLEDFMNFAEFLEIRGLKSESSSPSSPGFSGGSSSRTAPNGGLASSVQQNVQRRTVQQPVVRKPVHVAQTVVAGGMKKVSLKRPSPAAVSPAGVASVAAKAVVDPLASADDVVEGPQPKVAKEAPCGDGSSAALVKAELSEEEGDQEFDDLEDAGESYEEGTGQFDDGQDALPKNIPPSIVPDGPFERIGESCWKGRNHEGAQTYFCDLCLHISPWKRDGMRHELKHSGLRPFVCDMCTAAYKRREHLKRHQRTSHPEFYNA